MDLALNDKRTIVTGGASNIGQAIVWRLAEEGAKLAILDLDRMQAERTAERARELSGREVHVIEADLADHAAARAACGEAMGLLGGIDVLVTNVGWTRPDFFLETVPETWDHLLHVNLTSSMACVHAVLPSMIEQNGGSIVATTSTAALGEPRQGVYGAAKAGVVSYIRTVAMEYGRFGIRANLVAPGLVRPEEGSTGEHSLWRDPDAVMNAAQTEYVLKNTPLRRLSKAADIANAVAFLASDSAARQLTGQQLTVSGGFALR